MNKPDLIELIEYLESEQKSLEAQKNDCLKEWDYKGAHYFSMSLGQINHQLTTLYKLADPDYDLKRRLEFEKSLYDQDINEPLNEYRKKYYEEERKKLEEQIQKLNEKPKEKSLDGQEFDDAIYELLEKKIAGFKFHLIKRNDLYINFYLLDEKNMIISINPDTLANDNDNFYVKQKLPALGFIYNNEKSSMEYLYDLSNFKNSFVIKILISRIVFDVFYFRTLDKPAHIEKY